MAIDLWLLRHGEAEPYGLRDDAARELTERGRRQALAAGRALAALGARPAVVYASPKVRARDTAALACESLGLEVIEHRPLAYELAVSDLGPLLDGGGGGAIVLVGHEPHLSQLVHDCTGSDVRMVKGGLAGIRLRSGRGGELAALLRPRQIEALAG